MSKHLLISGFEIQIEAWVGDTEAGTATKIALEPVKVRPHDLAKWVMTDWPRIKQQLTEQVALIELQEVEAQLNAELRKQADEAAKPDPPKPAKKAGKVKKATKATEEAAVRARSYPSRGASST